MLEIPSTEVTRAEKVVIDKIMLDKKIRSRRLLRYLERFPPRVLIHALYMLAKKNHLGAFRCAITLNMLRITCCQRYTDLDAKRRLVLVLIVLIEL